MRFIEDLRNKHAGRGYKEVKEMSFIIFICQRLIASLRRLIRAYRGYKLGKEFAVKILKEWKEKKPAEHGMAQLGREGWQGWNRRKKGKER